MLDSNQPCRVWVFAALLAVSWGSSPALGQVDESSFDESGFDESGFDDPEFAPEPVEESATAENVAADGPAADGPAADAATEVEGAAHLSSEASRITSDPSDPARPLLATDPRLSRRLIFVDLGRESLFHMLELQLPDWHVRQVAARPTYLRIRRAQGQLMPDDAVVWIERSGDIERVALLDGAGDTPRSSTLPAAGGEEWDRAFALVVEGLIREQAMANQEAAESSPPVAACAEDGSGLDDHFDWQVDDRRLNREPSRPSLRRPRRWPTPIARDGWMFRFGWTHGFAPRRQAAWGWGAPGVSQYDFPSGGIRIAAGRWLHRNVRLSLTGEVAWANREPEGVLGLQAMIVSATRVRMGAGFELAALIVSENDAATGNRFGWFGYRIGLPMEVGLEINRKGGFFINMGPTWTKAPYVGTFYPGYQMSVEWEFN